MEVFKIDITSWTASFRYPNLISGFQPTLDVPPISTILGLVNAAMGEYMSYESLGLGYYFEYAAKAVDLETIYQMQGKNGTTNNIATSNVIRREFLFDASLKIYTKDENIANAFLCPVYPLLLGRSNDLATVLSVEKIVLDKNENANKIKGQVIPLFPYRLAGQIQALPKYFTNTYPRNNLGTEAFSVIGFDAPDCDSDIIAYRDKISENKYVDIFFHTLTV